MKCYRSIFDLYQCRLYELLRKCFTRIVYGYQPVQITDIVKENIAKLFPSKPQNFSPSKLLSFTVVIKVDDK